MPQTKNMSYRRLTSTGFSLVELLVSMVIGITLIGGMFTIFSGNQRSAALNVELAIMQESMRFALNAMSDDVRMAGYQGCLDLNGGTVDIIASDSPSLDLAATAISGAVIQNNMSWSPAPQLGTSGNQFVPPTSITPRAGTHTLAVQFAQTPDSGLSGPQVLGGKQNAEGPLELERAISVGVGDLVLVSSCEAGEIFTATQVSTSLAGGMTIGHDASANTRASFQRTYGLDVNIAQTRVMPFTTSIYFVAATGEDKPDGSSLFALYQQTMPFDESDNPPVMLVEGVENMRVLFGIGGDNGELRYVSADNSAYDPSRIRSVRIGLLMSSYDPLLDDVDPSSYQLVGESLSRSSNDSTAGFYSDDKRLRLAFNTTVSVRNRRAQ